MHCNVNMVQLKKPTDLKLPFLVDVINQVVMDWWSVTRRNLETWRVKLVRFNFSNLLTSIQTKRWCGNRTSWWTLKAHFTFYLRTTGWGVSSSTNPNQTSSQCVIIPTKTAKSTLNSGLVQLAVKKVRAVIYDSFNFRYLHVHVITKSIGIQTCNDGVLLIKESNPLIVEEGLCCKHWCNFRGDPVGVTTPTEMYC